MISEKREKRSPNERARKNGIYSIATECKCQGESVFENVSESCVGVMLVWVKRGKEWGITSGQGSV